jgi:hypothetical protein
MIAPEPVDTLPERRRRERLVALAVLGALALNYPLVALFSHVKLPFGIPLLYLYLFVVWLAIIALVAVAMARTDRDERNKAE